MRRLRIPLSTVQAVAVVLVSLALGPAASAAIAAPGDIGFADHGYAPIGGSPTGSKPESKLWFNDGVWWASMFNPTAGDHHIYRLDRTTQRWTDTGTAIDARDSSRADTMWVQATGKLYVASHGFTTTASTSTSTNGRLWRFSYNPATQTYTRDAGFPATMNTVRSETL